MAKVNNSEMVVLHPHRHSLLDSWRHFLGRHHSKPTECDQTYIKKLLAPLHGSVLMIGPGTSAAMQFLDPDVVSLVVAIETCSDRHSELATIAKERHIPLAVIASSLEGAHFDAEVFDSILLTYVFCCVADSDGMLSKIYNWLKPGGSISYLEHLTNGDPPSRHSGFSLLFQHQAGKCATRKELWKNIEKLPWDRGSEYVVFKHHCPKQRTIVEHLLGVAKKPVL